MKFLDQQLVLPWCASLAFGFLAAYVAEAASSAYESAREIPVAATVDVVVVGGTTAGVAAAVAARESGADVFLVGGYPYLGEDMAGTLELDNEGNPPTNGIVKSLWTSFDDLARYGYRFDAPIAQGPYAYCNDADDRVCDATWPMTPAETTVFASNVTYDCLLEGLPLVAKVEVVVAETPEDWLDGTLRPKSGLDSVVARVSDVELEIVEGVEQGRRIKLSRVASKESGGIHYRKRACLVTMAADIGSKIRSARVRFTMAKGAEEVCVSRIWFRMGAGKTVVSRPSPLKVKRSLDNELISRKIPFLTASPVTEVLCDDGGRLAGVVIANRSGRQVVRARCVVDATRYGTLSRLGRGLGLSGRVDFTRTLAFEGGALEKRTLNLDVGDGTFPFLARAESDAREQTWDPRLRDDADELVLVTPLPPPRMRVGLHTVDPQLPLEQRVALGVVAGRAAAAEAKTSPAPSRVSVESYASVPSAQAGDGDVKELLGGFRSNRGRPSLGTVHSSERSLPVLASCDVLVCGGGTSGAAAAIGAAKGGAKTIVAEWLHVLGGIGTDGMIISYCAGNNRGFTRRFCGEERRLGATHVYSSVRSEVQPDPDPSKRAETMYYQRSEVWRRWCRDAGVCVWYGTFVEGAYVQGNRVVGAVVVTPFGRGVVRARCVVDATGNADVAAAAGAETEFIPKSELQLQSAGLAPHRVRGKLVNTDFGFVNDADAWDLWLFGVRARAGASDAWDLQKLPDSRERRHIVPDYAVCGEDVVSCRKFPDTVVQPYAPQDAHGPLMEDFCYVSATSENVVKTRTWSYFRLNVPLRSLLPRGYSNIAVVGTGAGCSRDVMPMVRMQADLMNMGYAVGLGAALAPNGDFRRIDLAAFRALLVKEDIIERAALDWNDEEDYTSDEVVAAAIRTMSDAFRGSDVVFRRENREKALPLLRQAWHEASGRRDRFVYAQALGFLGDATGVESLIEAARGEIDLVAVHPKWRFGDRVNDMTGVLIALGRTRSEEAVAFVSAELTSLTVDVSIERLRGLTLASEALADPRLAPGLETFLRLPGIAGHAVSSPYELGGQGGYGPDFEMHDCMRELAVARALYFCGDGKGIGRRTLEAYANDPRGVLAEYASTVLKKGQTKR